MFCKNCGKQIPDNVNVCQYCGCHVNVKPREVPVASRQAMRHNENQRPIQPAVNSAAFHPGAVHIADNKKPPKKNIGLIVTAIVLVFAVLVSGTLCGVNIFRNKVSETDTVEYIEDFPVLKQQAELIVFNAENFPAEEYQITVERFLLGGVLKNISFRTTILSEISSDPVYNIDFGQDGEYRITLIDVTASRTQAVSENTDEGRTIIIDIIVNEKSEEAKDKVDIHSPDEPAIKILEATEDDWNFMTKLFNELQFYCGNYDCTNSDANYKAVRNTTFILSQVYDTCAEKYGFSEKEFCSTREKGADPLGRYTDSQKYEGYVKFDAEALDWIIKNVYNVQPLADEDTNEENGACAWYRHDGYYYSAWSATGEEWAPETTVINKNQISDGKYEVDVLTRFIEFGDEIGAEYNYKIIVSLNEVDGKRVWTFDRWESVEDKKETPTEVPPKSEYLEATDADWKNFNDLFSSVLFYCSKYDSNDKSNAESMALYLITYLMSPVYYTCAEKYNFAESEYFWNNEGYSDPLGKYPDEFDGFVRYDATSVDWIARNVLNVEPSKRIETGVIEGEQYTYWYRDDNYYYAHLFATGDGTNYDLAIKSKEKTADGKYNISLTATCTSYGEVYSTNQYEVTAALKDVDGKRVWSFEKWHKI